MGPRGLKAIFGREMKNLIFRPKINPGGKGVHMPWDSKIKWRILLGFQKKSGGFQQDSRKKSGRDSTKSTRIPRFWVSGILGFQQDSRKKSGRDSTNSARILGFRDSTKKVEVSISIPGKKVAVSNWKSGSQLCIICKNSKIKTMYTVFSVRWNATLYGTPVS